MCDAVQFQFSEFSKAQIERYQLEDFTGGDDLVTFRHPGKPLLILVLRNDKLELVRWFGTYPLPMLEDGGMSHSRPKEVLIAAEYAIHKGTRFKVAPAQIRGFTISDRRGRIAYILVQPASDYYERMTHAQWEPVYDREINYAS